MTQTEVEQQRRTEQLDQRAKELACLYDISDLVDQPGLSAEALLEGAVHLLPAACRFPEIAGARIALDDREYTTPSHRETGWRLAADLIVHSRRRGCVEVCYLEPGPWGEEGPFLAEERTLLMAVARRLGRTIERIRAEEQLRSQQQLLDLVLDSMPAYIACADPDLRLLHVNRAMAEWWGRSKEQVVGKNFKEVAPPGGYERNAPFLRQAVASRQTMTYDRQQTNAQGQSVVTRVTIVPHLDEQGTVQGLVVLILDVTTQKQAEEELRAHQERLDLIIDSMPAYVVYTDADWNILHANRAYARFWGRSKDEVVGKTVEEVASPKAYPELAHYLEQVRASRQTVSWEGEVASAAGTTHVMWRNYVPHMDEQGNVVGFVALIQDVTAQRQGAEALRASEERYRLVVDNMQEGVGIVDEAGKLTYVNNRLCEMAGRTRDELLGEPSAELFFGEEQERHLDQLARRRAGSYDIYESVFAGRDGAQVPVLISASPLTDGQGNYRGGFAVVADISVQKRVEQALIQAKVAAETAQAAAERARLEEEGRRRESERRRRLAEGLADVLAALNTKRSLDDVLNLVVRRARQLLGAQAAAIYGLEAADATLRVRATQGAIGPLFSEPSSLAIRALIEQAISQRRPVASAELPMDGGRDLDIDGRTGFSRAEGQGGFLAAPILSRDPAYGALVVYHSGPRPNTSEDKEIGALMAAQAALAVENTRLRAEVEEAAIAAERTRLARDLHDSVTQALFTTSLISQTLPRVWERHPQEGRRALDELDRLTRGALAEMRTLLLELRPAALLGQPLDALISQLVEAMPARTRIPVLMTTAGRCTPPEDVKLAVYRIAQEALNNIVKHARASRVRVDLRCEPNDLSLAIHDDGGGFDSAAVGSHQLGLGIMRERANAVGAHLSVESQPGQGTTIAVSWSPP